MTELKTVRLYGKLGAMFGREHRLAVDSPAEAVQALCAIKPGFERYLTESKDNGIGYTVYADKQNLGEDDLTSPVGDATIRIAPVPLGSKKQGFGQVIMGAILIVVGVVLYYFGIDGSFFIKMGVTMIIGGVVQMLMPGPKKPEDRDRAGDNSYVFNGPVNTQAQGNPVPLVYGRALVGSAVISAGIVANQEQIAGGTRTSGNVNGGINRVVYNQMIQ